MPHAWMRTGRSITEADELPEEMTSPAVPAMHHHCIRCGAEAWISHLRTGVLYHYTKEPDGPCVAPGGQLELER